MLLDFTELFLPLATCEYFRTNSTIIESQFALTELKSSSFFRQKITSVKITNKRATCATALKWNPNPKALSKLNLD